MISAFRRYLDTWYVRTFFVIMVGSFVFWGVGDVVRMIGGATWVVKLGGQTIEGQAFQAEYQRALSAATQALPPGQEATAELKRVTGDRTLQRMVGEAAMGALLRDMRLASPDTAVAATVRGMQAFKDQTGQFSKLQFDAVLRNNSLTEQRYLRSVRDDLTQRQLLGSVIAGATAPLTQAAPVYAALFEQRAADMVEFLFANAPPAPTPDEAALRRFYDNRPDIYATPEYRRVKLAILSAKSLEREIAITDEEIQAAYDRTRASYITPDKRSAQIVSVGDEAKARALLETWRAAPEDWAAIQAAAKTAEAAAIALDDAPRSQFPDPDLASAVFSAEVGSLTGPVKGGFGWYLLKVTTITPGSEKTLADVKDSLRERVLAEKATDILYSRANTVDNLLGNGGTLDDLPGDLGLIAVTGTLDAEGRTPEGQDAPLPEPRELRDALVAAAFQVRIGDPPRLTEVKTPAGPAYFALVVEDVTPPSVRPYDDIRTRVAGDWAFEQQRRAQEEAAAAMLAAIQAGRNFPDAATIAGVIPRLTSRVTRGEGVAGIPPELHRILFGLKKNEPTMVETAEGFVVAIPVEIVVPNPKDDEAGYARMRGDLARNIGNDFATVFQEAVRLRANPRVNQTNFNQIVQPR